MRVCQLLFKQLKNINNLNNNLLILTVEHFIVSLLNPDYGHNYPFLQLFLAKLNKKHTFNSVYSLPRTGPIFIRTANQNISTNCTFPFDNFILVNPHPQ